MPRDFLHNHPQFADLIRIVADDQGIAPALVEKDYWIMQSLYGLQQLGLAFELKGGTSLSKGYGLIRRFSEDIDIRIEPPADPPVMTEPIASRQRSPSALAGNAWRTPFSASLIEIGACHAFAGRPGSGG